MNHSERTAVAYIRQRRKCCTSAGILLVLFTMTILLCQTCDATTSSSSSSLLHNDKQKHIKSTDLESVELQQMKMSSDVVLPAQHPVVYKEDYVKQRNGFDETNLNAPARKNQKHLTKQLKAAESPYKMDSHVKPHVPTNNKIHSVDNNNAGFKLNGTVLQVDVNDTPLKQQLNKRPKKYSASATGHKRLRRSSEDQQHIVKKRNPSIQHYAGNWPAFNHMLPNGYAYYTYKSHPVQGNYWNGIDGVVPTTAPQPFFIGNRVGGDDEERVVWERFRPTVPPLGSLFHDSNPEHADTSFMTRRPPQQMQQTNNRIPPQAAASTTTTQSPVTFGSIFHDSNPDNADLSFLRRQTPQVEKFQQQQESQQQRSAMGVKKDRILFRSSQVDDAIEYDDVYSDASEAQVQQTPPSDEAFCAFAIISCCRHDMNQRSKCFSDWQCKFTTTEMKQKCN